MNNQYLRIYKNPLDFVLTTFRRSDLQEKAKLNQIILKFSFKICPCIYIGLILVINTSPLWTLSKIWHFIHKLCWFWQRKFWTYNDTDHHCCVVTIKLTGKVSKIHNWKRPIFSEKVLPKTDVDHLPSDWVEWGFLSELVWVGGWRVETLDSKLESDQLIVYQLLSK